MRLIATLSLTLVSTVLLAGEPAAPAAGTAQDGAGAPGAAAATAGETAQAPAAVRPPPRTHRAHGRPSLDARVNQFAKNYGLSESQRAAVKRILEQRQQEDLQIRSDASIDGAARIERFRALQVATVARIRDVLTEQQRLKYNPLATKDLPKQEGQRSVEDWLQLTTPH